MYRTSILTKDIVAGALDVAYSREHSETNADMVPGFPNGPYFVPGSPWQRGQWVRLVLEKSGRAEERTFLCIGKLVSATDTEAIVEDIVLERGPAPAHFEELAWSGVLRREGDAWPLRELAFVRDFEKERGPMRKAIASGDIETVVRILDRGLPIDRDLSLEGPPLVLAVKHGQSAIVELLLERGAEINVRSSEGTLYEVARRGKATLELVAFLRAKGMPTPDTAPKPALPVDPFAVGAAIAHAKFGEGTVLSTEGSGDTRKVTIAFANGEKKTLLASFLAR